MSTTTVPQADTAATPQLTGETGAGGAFKRQENAFRDRITADGSSGYKAEPGRYHLYVSLACPWAHRTLIVRKLKGLADVVSASSVDPIRDERGWAFRESADGSYGPDPVNGFRFLSEAYLATDPGFTGRYTVPAVWDRRTGRIVTNDFHTIPTQLETEFEAFADASVDLYPESLRPEIDAVNRMVYERVNNGVYEAGFATSQAAYDRAFDALFAALDELETRLAGQRFLVGERVTDADVRLFTTLARFDAVYHGHFKCNLRRLVDSPNLWNYARDLYQRPGFGETTNFDHIKRHYYQTHDKLNPSRIVPKGPAVDWLAPPRPRPAGLGVADGPTIVTPAAPVSVRPARPEEYPAAGALVADVYAAAGYSHGPYLDVLRNAARRAAVAELLVAVDAAGRVLGTVTYAAGGTPFADIAAPDEAEFRMLAVDPSARGRGVGEELVRACVERARAQGKRRLAMSTQPEMRTAHRLYDRLGFRRAPERDWSPEPGLRLRVYARELDGADERGEPATAGPPAHHDR